MIKKIVAEDLYTLAACEPGSLPVIDPRPRIRALNHSIAAPNSVARMGFDALRTSVQQR